MTEPEHLQRLQRLASGAAAAPIRVEVRELFCERVDRIRDAEVYCIGVGLSSPGLRALKDAWVAESPVEQRKVHVPYDSEGHISLAYVSSQFAEQARNFVAEHGPRLQDGRGLTLDHISYEDEFGKEIAIALGAGSASGGEGPPSKGARRGPAPGVAVAGGGGGELVEIDGSVLEGGGQILRMSSSYSALFGKPIHISKIRAGRSKPGLAAQHLESMRLVRDVSAGTLTNDRIGSIEVTLTPQGLFPGYFTADPGTAGAVTLMVQASLMPLLFTGGTCNCDLRGGTDVSFSPPLDFLRRVLLPTLRRMGVSISMDVLLRGFFPKGGGHVELSVPPLAEPLAPIDLSERGEPASVKAVLYSTKPAGHEERASLEVVRQSLAHLAPQVSVEFSLAPAPQNSWKYWLDVVVETSTGALFHGNSEPKDLPWTGKSKGKGGGSLSGLCWAAASEATKHLKEQLNTGAAVEVHLADQLILPASLAAGTSRLLVAELSMHSRTAIYIAELLVPGVRFREERRGALSILEIDGISYEPPPSVGGEKSGGSSAAEVSSVPPGAAPAVAALSTPAPAARPSEDILKLAAGSLSRATSELLSEFRSDMMALAGATGAFVSIDIPGDRLVISGELGQRREALDELKKPDGVLGFYHLRF